MIIYFMKAGNQGCFLKNAKGSRGGAGSLALKIQNPKPEPGIDLAGRLPCKRLLSIRLHLDIPSRCGVILSA